MASTFLAGELADGFLGGALVVVGIREDHLDLLPGPHDAVGGRLVVLFYGDSDAVEQLLCERRGIFVERQCNTQAQHLAVDKRSICGFGGEIEYQLGFACIAAHRVGVQEVLKDLAGLVVFSVQIKRLASHKQRSCRFAVEIKGIGYHAEKPCRGGIVAIFIGLEGR